MRKLDNQVNHTFPVFFILVGRWVPRALSMHKHEIRLAHTTLDVEKRNDDDDQRDF